MAVLFIGIMTAIIVYLVMNNRENKTEYVSVTPQSAQKDKAVDALSNHPFVQESIRSEGKFYPSSLPLIKNKIGTLTHDQKKACINLFVVLEIEVAKQVGVSKAEALVMACMIVGNWFGHGHDYISYLLYRAEESDQLIDNIDSIVDVRIKESILFVSCEIAGLAKDNAKAMELATTPFKVMNWSKAKIFEAVRKGSVEKDQNNTSDNVVDYLKTFSDFFGSPEPVKAWNMTIMVNPDNRSELLYYKNNQQKNLIQPHCGRILQLVFVQAQEPQFWVLGTKGLQAYENGQFSDVLKCYDGQNVIKETDNPMIDIAGTARGDIYGFYRNGEKVLIKPAQTNSTQII